MVCTRCVLAVEQQLKALGIQATSVVLGEVELNNTPTETQMKQLAQQLTSLGFEILDDQRKQQIEKIKNLLIEQIQSDKLEEHFSLTEFLGSALNKEYSQISRLFSQVEGITVEHYFILQKIEKVKEWLAYDELTLSEIAWKLGYSSVAHLSAQFKKVTGMTPTRFKTLGVLHRKSLDRVRSN